MPPLSYICIKVYSCTLHCNDNLRIVHPKGSGPKFTTLQFTGVEVSIVVFLRLPTKVSGCIYSRVTAMWWCKAHCQFIVVNGWILVPNSAGYGLSMTYKFVSHKAGYLIIENWGFPPKLRFFGIKWIPTFIHLWIISEKWIKRYWRPLLLPATLHMFTCIVYLSSSPFISPHTGCPLTVCVLTGNE